MAIGQSFGMQFGYQTMIPKKDKKEELQSRMFPGLDDGQSKRLVETVDKMGITDSGEKLKKQQEIYKEILPQVKAKEAQMNRQVIKNEQYNATLDIKDTKQKAVKMAALKIEDLADMIKEKYGLDPNAPTDGIISEYNTMLNDMGIDEKLVEDYMNGKSDELLYATDLKARPEDNTAKGIGDFLSGKPISTEREVSKFMDPFGKKGTGGADVGTALNLVGKGLLNLIPNTISFAKGVGSMIFHPKQTVEGLKSIGQGIIDQAKGETDTPQAQMVSGMWDNIKETVTDPQKLGQFIAENPLDIITAVNPKAAVDVTKGLVKGTTKAISTVTKPLARGTEKAAEFITSQAFGINPSTLKQIVKDPALYNQVERGIINSEELLGTLGNKIDEKIVKIGETGKGYQTIKEVANIQAPVDEIKSVLTKRGISIGKDGKLNFANTNMADTSDMNAIQKAYDFITSQDNLLGGNKINVINIRGKLDDLINYESKTTSKGQGLVKEMRGIIDTKAKKEIPGLSQLDETYSTEVKELKAIKKDFLNADGTFKDNALSKISNLTKKGNEAKLERVKELVPGIEENINAVRAFEDVTLAGGQKVGTYIRGAAGVGLGAATGNPVMAIVGLLLTSPQVATNLLKGLGYSKQFISGLVKNLKSGIKITQAQMNILEQGAKGIVIGGAVEDNLSLTE